MCEGDADGLRKVEGCREVISIYTKLCIQANTIVCCDMTQLTFSGDSIAGRSRLESTKEIDPRVIYATRFTSVETKQESRALSGSREGSQVGNCELITKSLGIAEFEMHERGHCRFN